jgi:hypothetical protein
MRATPVLLLLAPVLLALAACPPAKDDKPLPPSGLAGGPGGAGGAGGAAAPHASGDPHAGGTALPMPGAGASGDPGYKLPSGHPPIDEAANAAAEHPKGGAEHPKGGAEHPAAAAAEGDLKLKGKVLEVLEVPQYTYMRLSTPGGEVWAAVGKTKVKVGDEVAIAQPMVMENFPSKALNRTFDKLIMGNLVPPAGGKG